MLILRIFGVFLLISMLSTTLCAQETAPEIVAKDCEGIEHNLYSKLEEGKVIVIGWTMPCASCAGPLLEVHNVVMQYAISNPGTVEYWLADDYAETTCQTVKDWSNTNGITNATFFSTVDLDMYDFGSIGMPKVVVIGCKTGIVYYNYNDFINSQGVGLAIKNAISDIGKGCENLSIGANKLEQEVSIYPSPTTGSLNVSSNSYLQVKEIMVINSLGQTVISNVISENELSTNMQIDVSSLENGFYHVVLNDGDNVAVFPFQKQ